MSGSYWVTQEAIEEIIRNCIDKAKRIGATGPALSRMVVVALAGYFNGQQFYFPTGNQQQRLRDAADNHARIYEESNGANTAELAKKYGKTVRTIQRIIVSERDRRRKVRDGGQRK
jgi:Mor family transcriptional regulator